MSAKNFIIGIPHLSIIVTVPPLQYGTMQDLAQMEWVQVF